MNRLEYLKNVTTLRLDTARCTGCGMCEIVCPHTVFHVASGKAEIVRKDACMECGACAGNCRFSALSVQKGVGCAAAVVNSLIGRNGACNCDCSC